MRRIRQQIKKPFIIPRFLPWLITALWWILLLGIFFLVEPQRLQNVMVTGMYLPFLLLVFLATSFTMFNFRHRLWPSIIWAGAISLFLILRIYGWGNWLNFLTLAAIMAVLEKYWRGQTETNVVNFN